MKKIRWVISLIAVFLAFSPASGKTSEYSINPQPPEAQTSLKILTLNVMQRDSVNVPPVSRDSRFQGIADFLKNKNIHALTLQELSGGFLDVPNTTVDSGIDLAHKLAQQGQQYGYYTRDSYGYPDYLTFKVGVMPKYTMLFTDATRLDPSGENWSGGPVEFDGRSNAVVCGLNIPGIGRVNLYSVHVYTPTTVDQKETQIQNLIDFIHQVDLINPARLTIVGGDMNFAVSSGTQNIYQTFLGDGFVDSYMAVNSDSGDTFSLPDNPFKNPSITTSSRIDYLFVKGDNFQIANSEVVFNGSNGAFVSDHCGLLTEIVVLAPLPGNNIFLGSGLIGLAGWRRLRRS